MAHESWPYGTGVNPANASAPPVVGTSVVWILSSMAMGMQRAAQCARNALGGFVQCVRIDANDCAELPVVEGNP